MLFPKRLAMEHDVPTNPIAVDEHELLASFTAYELDTDSEPQFSHLTELAARVFDGEAIGHARRG
jgi:hypothetical protein